MVCKNCAAMKTPDLNRSNRLPDRRPSALTLLLCLSLLATSALAEKADRLKPLNITSDQGGRIDVANQRTEFVGAVVLSKGSMVLHAERIAVSETADGYYQAKAGSLPGQQVRFRQARDVPGEAIEGFADQLEFDTRADTVRFIGNAVVRIMRGALVADEVTGAVILFDNRTEVFTLEAGAGSPHPSGRARMVMMPREITEAQGTEPAAPALPLQPSLSLQPRKPK